MSYYKHIKLSRHFNWEISFVAPRNFGGKEPLVYQPEDLSQDSNQYRSHLLGPKNLAKEAAAKIYR
jgi:hypothetical protein